MIGARMLIICLLLIPVTYADVMQGASYAYTVDHCRYVTNIRSTNTCMIEGVHPDGNRQQLAISQGDRLTLTILNNSVDNHPQYPALETNFTIFVVYFYHENVVLKISDGSHSITILDGADNSGLFVNTTLLEQFISQAIGSYPTLYSDQSTYNTIGYTSILEGYGVVYRYRTNTTISYYRDTGLLKSYFAHTDFIGIDYQVDFGFSNPQAQSFKIRINAFLPVYVVILLGIFRKSRRPSQYLE